MLVGRARERALLRGLVAAARVGESGFLVLRGEPGIGKSALLDDTAGAASGMRLLRATGSAAEAGLPFAGLLQLLRPVLGYLDDLPAPQSHALGVAFALHPGPGGDRFTIGAGVLSLLSRVAQDGPVLVLIDDAHLLDRPSSEALLFAARRFTADPVAILSAAREDPPSAWHDPDLPVLPVAGLGAEEARTLLRSALPSLDAEVAQRLHAATAGNPLALLELSPADLDELFPETPVPVPASLARTFARRADRLSAPARTLLLLTSAGTARSAPGARRRAPRRRGPARVASRLGQPSAGRGGCRGGRRGRRPGRRPQRARGGVGGLQPGRAPQPGGGAPRRAVGQRRGVGLASRAGGAQRRAARPRRGPLR